MEMSFPVRFPEVYERVSPPRSDAEIEREMNRRCGYSEFEDASPVQFADHAVRRNGRSGTHWNGASAPGTRLKNSGQKNRPLVRK